MKVLVVSHNAMDLSSNMGKTLCMCFSGFSKGELAQFYIQDQPISSNGLCEAVWRYTDRDALRSWLTGKRESKGSVHMGNLTWLYRAGRQRTGWCILLRDLLWKYSTWDRVAFWDWVEGFQPDVIFLAAGDYGFLYRIARKIAVHTGKPLVVYCADDFYLYNRNAKSMVGRFAHRQYLKIVFDTMEKASAIFCICREMQITYADLFRKPCFFLPTAAKNWHIPLREGKKLSYIGNLENKRAEALAEIGRALEKIWQPGMPCCLDIYSAESDPRILNILRKESGICFHGAVPPEQIPQIMADSLAVVHVESFDRDIQNRVRLSMSTKIPESLYNGPCLIAYGPETVASIAYLKEYGAAYVISDPNQLEAGLKKILTANGLRQEIVSRARQLAQENHDAKRHAANFRKQLEEICRRERKAKEASFVDTVVQEHMNYENFDAEQLF